MNNSSSCLTLTKIISTLPFAFSLTVFSLIFSSWDGRATVSERITGLLNQEPMINGPNCWNSVLYTQGFVSNIRFTSSDELEFWLESSFCRKVIETPKHGDLIVIRSTEEVVHSMIWTGSDEVFSKGTSHKLDPYVFIKSDLIYSMFRVDQAHCRTADGNHQGCLKWADYYRCSSSETQRNDFAKRDPKYRNLWRRATILNQSVSDLAFSKRLTRHQLIEASINLQYETTLLRQDWQSYANQKESFFWTALLKEIDSLSVQVKILNSMTSSR